MNTAPVITIDGPSGSGKGTISKMLADALGWHFLDSGAIYRAIALYCRKKNISIDDKNKLAQLAENLPLRFMGDEIFLADENVTVSIRNEEVSALASKIAKILEVRQALVTRQRSFSLPPGLVADGRDMGTIIFPDAKIKIFLDASVEERAKRRYLQLNKQGNNVSLERVLLDLSERDCQDRQREVAPLIPAKDALVIDSTHLSVENVFQQICKFLESYGIELKHKGALS